jgi:CRISP-associated protein Cas1
VLFRSAEMARPMVAAKILNCRELLMRAARDRPAAPGAEDLSKAVSRLRRLALCLEEPVSLECLRGVEGDAAKTYFGVFDHLVTGDKKAFFFHGRSRRPPMDNLNCLLSFLYTLLALDLRSALEVVGLDPQMGFLHSDRPGRPSLALDLMEELRAPMADRLALNLINRRQVSPKGFRMRETGAVMMEDQTRKDVITAWQQRKQEEVAHSFLQEKIPRGLLPHAQAMLLARALRGDVDGYAPWIRS